MSQKESQQWLHRLEAVFTAHDCCPTTRLVRVGDREADVYAVLAAPRPAGVDLLMRAAWDRGVQGAERSVWATVTTQPVSAHLQWQVPRRGPQAAREATLALRFCPLTLRPPRQRQRAGLPAVTLWTGQVQAVEPPAESTPIAWRLWTTVAVDTVDDATERVQWSSCRWGLAVWQRMLKSGGRIAARQLASGERLQRCLTLSSVIAWRIFSATMLARAVPDLPCSVWLDLDEWQALYGAIHQCPTPPEEPPSLAQAVHWLAHLGGFVGRRRRDQPGAETLWRGLQH